MNSKVFSSWTLSTLVLFNFFDLKKLSPQKNFHPDHLVWTKEFYLTNFFSPKLFYPTILFIKYISTQKYVLIKKELTQKFAWQYFFKSNILETYCQSPIFHYNNIKFIVENTFLSKDNTKLTLIQKLLFVLG